MKFIIYRFKKVKSTNDTAIRILKKFKNNYGMIISETQTNGRGQYGNKWISLNGNLFMSLFFEIENFRFSLTKLTTLNCLLIKKVLSFYYKKKIVLKKPNDLIIDKKKICGILQETVSINGKKFLVVGIGLNLIKNPNIRDYPTTNLYTLTNKKVPKKKIENEIKKIFEKNLIKSIPFIQSELEVNISSPMFLNIIIPTNPKTK